MDSKYQTIETYICSLLDDLNNVNAREKLEIIHRVKKDVENAEDVIKRFMDIATEIDAFTKTGEQKYYPDTTKEKLRS